MTDRWSYQPSSLNTGRLNNFASTFLLAHEILQGLQSCLGQSNYDRRSRGCQGRGRSPWQQPPCPWSGWRPPSSCGEYGMRCLNGAWRKGGPGRGKAVERRSMECEDASSETRYM